MNKNADNGLSEEKRNELRKKLKNKIDTGKIQRTNKKCKDKLVDRYCKDNNLDKKMLENMAKSMYDKKQ